MRIRKTTSKVVDIEQVDVAIAQILVGDEIKSITVYYTDADNSYCSFDKEGEDEEV